MPFKRVERESLKGKRFTRLLVLDDGKRGKDSHWIYTCICDCGKTIEAHESRLIANRQKSCGCKRKEMMAAGDIRRTHGMGRSPEHRTWLRIKNRCHNPNAHNYSYYGGRGISVCDEWRNSFEAFFRDMGLRPSPKHSIERDDVNGNYEKNNCRWATLKEQHANKRNSRRITYKGETKTLSEWARIFGINRCTISDRLKRGLAFEVAILRLSNVTPKLNNQTD